MRNTAQSSTRGLIFGALIISVLAVPASAHKPAVTGLKAQTIKKTTNTETI